VVNFVNSEYFFLFPQKSNKKSQSYNQKQSGTFFMVHSVYILLSAVGAEHALTCESPAVSLPTCGVTGAGVM